MEYATLLFRFVLALLFSVAGLAKLAGLHEFQNALRRYELLPERLTWPAALALPPVEVGCGVLLGLGAFTTAVASTVAAILVAFSGAVAVNLARGHEITCGCFGSAGSARISWLTVVRNLALIVMALAVAAYAPTPLSIDGYHSNRSSGVLAAGDAIAVVLLSVVALTFLSLARHAWRYKRMVNRVSAVVEGRFQ